MAHFQINGSIERLGPERFVSTVVAHPADGIDSALGHSLSETCGSESGAVAALRRLSGELAERIRSRGDSVLAVEIGPA